LAYEKLGRDQDALAQLDEAVNLSPNSADAHLNIGIVQQKRGNTEEAKKSFEKCLEVNPKVCLVHVYPHCC
jgi:Tfp pilus assembly protein PilF